MTSRSLTLGLAAGLLCLSPAAPLPGGGQRQGKAPRNDPASCPYCGGEPERMARAGIVSHGGFAFGTTDTAGVDAYLATSDIRWIESAHFELGFALGPHRPKGDERSKLRAELTRLAEVLDEVNPKTRSLDPWLRAHLYAQRAEDLWDRFLELMQVAESDFPEKAGPHLLGERYMGNGPFLGQAGKYEILILPSEAASVQYLTKEYGLPYKRTQRWNHIPLDSITLTIHTAQGSLKNDEALHGHLAHNLAHNLLDGFKHYSYETPVWLHEGLAHFVEREINPRFNSFDFSEGAVADMSRKSDWEAEVLKLIRADEAPRLAELVALKTYGEMDIDDHYVCWSMVAFAVQEHPEAFACLNDRLHGRLDEQGFTQGADLGKVHRQALKDCFGMSYLEFDRAWAEWCRTPE